MLRRTIRQNAVLAAAGDIKGRAQCSVVAARTIEVDRVSYDICVVELKVSTMRDVYCWEDGSFRKKWNERVKSPRKTESHETRG